MVNAGLRFERVKPDRVCWFACSDLQLTKATVRDISAVMSATAVACNKPVKLGNFHRKKTGVVLRSNPKSHQNVIIFKL
jgi:hypothetical protein